MKNTNTLSYKTYEDNHLSFELLIDGKPLADYLEFKDTKIPYWIVKKGLPIYKWTGERIVAVCGCGEYGCDCVLCSVVFEEQFVILREFHRERASNFMQREFKLTLENFQDVESKISIEADKYRETE